MPRYILKVSLSVLLLPFRSISTQRRHSPVNQPLERTPLRVTLQNQLHICRFRGFIWHERSDLLVQFYCT
ncbi:hypothetical protein L6164_032480 [Bauhinia variegata]|uniref:Uncharacterized protein n=1 Tax=Bauhinia variegata TaxID=167791 RepID=A0ACB9KPN3_BAUVA|nr:hypothetical protein L6164_032480 [Bauhinia variegata]